MTENREQEWRERFAAMIQRTQRERARKAAERLEFKTRRDYGLAARHKAKLARRPENRED